ncbi:MAG: ORF6N domain-containing protein [candidate division WOR-3 bacterium]
MKKPDNYLVPSRSIDRAILFLRGRRVMLDADLAALYGVPTRRLNEQVRRNRERFPADFVFQLTADEKAEVVAKCDHLSRLRFSPVRPYAFTEHGAVMAASVLNSKRAVEVSVFVVRAFVRLQQAAHSYREIALKLTELEKRLASQDVKILALFDAMRSLMRSSGRGATGVRPH